MAKRVVLVDDSRTIIASLEMALEEFIDSGEIEVKAYLDPQSCLNDLNNANENFDLMFCDINMPVVSGMDLVAQVKSNPNHKNKKIIMLTTESSDEIKNKGKAIGVSGWMVKPFSADKIVKVTKMMLG